MLAPLTIAVARPADWPEVARWTFAHFRPPFAQFRADRLVGLLADNEVSSGGMLVATRDGTAVGGMAVQDLPGRAAVVLPPGGHSEAVRDALVGATVERFRTAGILLGQAFVDPAEEGQGAVLLRHGFRQITSVVRLTQEAEPLAKAIRLPHVKFVFHTDTPGLFADTLLQTYRDSLDVPEANVGATAAELLAGFAADQPRPPRWWLATDPAGDPLGVLLLAVDRADGWEVAYLGVVPSARGRGVGAVLLRYALAVAKAEGVPLSLTVDERNEPALRLYAAAGFARQHRQLVYLWRHWPDG